MKTWLVKDARARFGDVLASARAGEPQRITNRGRDAVVMISEAQWRRLQPADPNPPAFPPFPLTPEEWDEIKPGPIPLRPHPMFEDL